jgi:glycosyltransferase involved in cell wall biosynthesis
MSRIGIDGRMMGNINGGIGRYVFELTRHILEKDSENEYFLFYNERNSNEKDINFFSSYKNLTLIKTKYRHYSFLEQLSFPRLLKKYNLDLVHFPNFNVPVFYKGKFVVTIHDVVHHKISGAKKSRLLHFAAYKKVINFAAKNSQKIITVSRSSAEDISSYFKVPGEKVSVIYEGSSLDPQVSESDAKKVLDKYLINKPYFLFVGVLERKKNIIGLTRGFDLFIKNFGLDMDLVIVGKADKHYPEIRHHAMDIKNKNRLVFTGFAGDNDLRALYKGAYAFVSASLHEGYGLPGVEAMNFGLPLVVSNTSVFNEIYDNAAIYFDPLDVNDIAQKMNLVVQDKLYYEKIREASLKRALIFDWDKAAKETLEVYNQSLSAPKI